MKNTGFEVGRGLRSNPDVTHGSWIYAAVSYIEKGNEQMVSIGRISEFVSDWWKRSGTCNRPGLSCPVGEHAINPVPEA